MSTFHIQARLLKRDAHRVVRDEVRLADADSRDEAFRVAHDLVCDGFTVWIWANVTRSDGRADLDLVETLRPSPRPHSTPEPTGVGRSQPRARLTGGRIT